MSDLHFHPAGLLLALGLTAGIATTGLEARRKDLPLAPLAGLLPHMLIGLMLGGRLCSVAFSANASPSAALLQVIRFWDGGSVAGAVTGASAVILPFLAITLRGAPAKTRLLYVDALVLGAAVALFIARIGCAVVHDHPGTATSSILGIAGICRSGSPQDACHDLGLYECALLSLGLLALCLFRHRFSPGRTTALCLFVYALWRLSSLPMREGEVTQGSLFWLLLLLAAACFNHAIRVVAPRISTSKGSEMKRTTFWKSGFRTLVSLLLLITALGGLSLGWMGCGGGTTDTFVCPTAAGPQDVGTVPPMAGRSSVDITLDRLYLLTRIRAQIETPAAQSGVFVNNLEMTRVTDGGRSVSALQLIIEPWLRGQSGPVSLNRTYRLTLKVMPRLVNSTSVPNPARRKQLLCPMGGAECAGDEGVVLTFEFFELYNRAFGRPACTTPDTIDEMIIPQVIGQVGNQAPLTLPVDAISALLASAGGTARTVIDVTVGGDQFLKIGLLYCDDCSHAFDGVTQLLSRYPGRDWYVEIDKAVMSGLVRSKMQEKLDGRAPGSTITSFTTTFSNGEIVADAVAQTPVPGICGTSATIRIYARSPTKVCKSGSSSLIVSWNEPSDTSNNFCVNLSKFWSSIGVGTISGPPDVWPTLAPVTFSAGPGDEFYGTDLDLDNTFGIVGRSRLQDEALKRMAPPPLVPRTELPAACPGT